MDVNDIIRDKINVFISSRCGVGWERYDNVRKQLKERIENSGMASVYIFEDGLASTQTAEQEYLYAIDDSDVCLFLIDNKDDITPAVYKEIQRANSRSKKSIYLFCNEKQSEETQIQKELIGADGPRFYEINSFDEFIGKGYESLINDIAVIYKYYCEDRLIDPEFGNSEGYKFEADYNAFKSIGKHFFKGLDKTKDYITYQIDNTQASIRETNELDKSYVDFLFVLFGEKSIREFNASLLLDELKKEQSENLYEVVEARWKAIQKYWQGNLESCIESLEKALARAREHSMPRWIIQDILLDLRNVNSKKCEEENSPFHQSNAQRELNEMQESLNYPILDRYTNRFYEEIDKQSIKFKIKSPYSVTFGNQVITLADYMTNIYAIAAFHGSLTYILLTIDRMKSAAFHLCETYDDWQFRVLLLKMVMYNGNKKEIKNFIRTINDVFGKMNPTDALDIYNFSCSHPIKYQRNKACLGAFNYLGNFFSDEDFKKVEKEMLDMINNWVADNDRVIAIGSQVFESLKSNQDRIDSNKIAKICTNVISKKITRFYDDVFDLLSILDLKGVENDILANIISDITELVADEDESKKNNKLLYAIINIRKSKEELTSNLHENVLWFLPDSSKNVYNLETMTKTQEDSIVHLFKYIEEINERNITQGKGGVYSGYSNNPYKTLQNIIINVKGTLPDDMIFSISEAAADTLINKRQLISDKVKAMQLIVFMKKYCDNIAVNDLYSRLNNKKDLVNNGEDDIFEKHSIKTLHFNFLMIEIVYGGADYNKFLGILGMYNKLDDFEKIKSLEAIINLLKDTYCFEIDKNILFMLLQFVLSMSHEASHEVRYHAVEALLLMITEDTEETVLTQLSQFMDYDSAYIKSNIISQFDRLIKVNHRITRLMIQKASVDNHYIVREKGRQYLKEYEI